MASNAEVSSALPPLVVNEAHDMVGVDLTRGSWALLRSWRPRGALVALIAIVILEILAILVAVLVKLLGDRNGRTSTRSLWSCLRLGLPLRLGKANTKLIDNCLFSATGSLSAGS